MTTDEAYQHTMGIVDELIRDYGISVVTTPSKSRNDPEVVAKYNGPERVSPDKWVRVNFKPQTDYQKAAITRRLKELNWLGVHFDSGGYLGHREWELDWSFKYTGQPDGQAEPAQDAVEDLIRGTIENPDFKGPVFLIIMR